MKYHGINMDRFVPLLIKRRLRNPEYQACNLPELKQLAWYSDALSHAMREEVCREIERLAAMHERSKDYGGAV